MGSPVISTSQKHARRCAGASKLPIIVNKCAYVCVCGVRCPAGANVLHIQMQIQCNKPKNTKEKVYNETETLPRDARWKYSAERSKKRPDSQAEYVYLRFNSQIQSRFDLELSMQAVYM